MNNFDQLKKIFDKREKKKIYFYLILTIINPIVEVVGIGSLVGLILFFFNSIDSNFNLVFETLNLEWLKFSLTFSIQEILYLIIIIFIIKAIYSLLYSYYETKLRNDLVAQKSKYAFNHFINTSYIKIKDTTKSEVFNLSILEAARVVDYIIGLTIFIRELILLLLLFVSLLLLNIYYTSFLFSTLITFTGLIYYFFSKKMYIIGNNLRIFQQNLTNTINETVSSIKALKLLNKTAFFINKFNLLTDERKLNMFSQQYVKKLPRIIFEAYLVVIVCSTILLFYSEEDMEKIISYIAILGLISSRLLPSFTNINTIYATVKFNEASINNFYNKIFLDQKKIIENEDQDKLLMIKDINKISVLDLDYYYDGKKKIIDSLSFEIVKGEIFGIFGRSGSGKSTLVDILSGLIKPKKGKIFINQNEDIKEFSVSWRSMIGYVPQTPLLLNDTIENNICLGVEKNKINREKLREVTDITNLTSLIEDNNKSQNIFVGESGNKLSGGQKQRVSIARTLYFNPKILILDEATSSLDENSENEIFNLVNKLKNDHIVVLISHNEKIKQLCEKSINLDDYNEK
ncbi:ABC transporter ATP-binding protein/permease [Candidatus Pelagibacter sp.]|nr:ABC transporter ATP-binding protein/permease [Candidatus Pelagibacter sp.]